MLEVDIIMLPFEEDLIEIFARFMSGSLKIIGTTLHQELELIITRGTRMLFVGRVRILLGDKLVDRVTVTS